MYVCAGPIFPFMSCMYVTNPRPGRETRRTEMLPVKNIFSTHKKLYKTINSPNLIQPPSKLRNCQVLSGNVRQIFHLNHKGFNHDAVDKLLYGLTYFDVLLLLRSTSMSCPPCVHSPHPNHTNTHHTAKSLAAHERGTNSSSYQSL